MSEKTPRLNFLKLRQTLARLFLGRIAVYSLSKGPRCVRVATLRCIVDIHRVLPEVHISSLSLLSKIEPRNLSPQGGVILHKKCSSYKISFCGTGCHVACYSALLSLPHIYDGRDKMFLLPQTRQNRSSYIREKLGEDGLIFLAYFSPVIQKAVLKSILNKETGTLLIWYNSQSRSFFSQGLALFSPIGGKGGLVWKWIELPGEIHDVNH